MDLLRAHDVLSNAPQDTEDLAQRKEKTEACRVIADQVCAPAFRYFHNTFYIICINQNNLKKNYYVNTNHLLELECFLINLMSIFC